MFGRFEAGDPNELWTGDALHGRRIGGRKTYLFAFIDDHSRLVVGHRWGFAEDTVRLAAALRPALGSRGIPRNVYVDNGSAFVDAWLLRACAKLGIRLTHSTPGRPQGRGKIERFFRTVNEQFLVEIPDTTAEELTANNTSPAAALLELNRLFTGWVETVYHQRVHTETEQQPLHRWTTGWERTGRRPQIPGTDDLAEAFRWAEFRTVTKTATVSLFSNTYQVDPSLTGRRVELVFDPFDMTDIAVRHHGATLREGHPAHRDPAFPPQGPTRNRRRTAGPDRYRLPQPGRRSAPRPRRAGHQLPRPDHRRHPHPGTGTDAGTGAGQPNPGRSPASSPCPTCPPRT